MSIFAAALTLLLSWGALAIGGLPSWAAAPILVFGVTTGILGFLEPNSTHSHASFHHAGLLAAIALFIGAISLQLVPLSDATLKRLSPARVELDYERLLAIADRRDPAMVPTTAPGAARPISIAPSRTLLGLAGVIGFAVFLLGTARGLSMVGVRGISRSIVVLGIVVTFIEIHRRATNTVAIYGLYVPLNDVHRSAPFINRNHQSGWLVMVLALTLGAFAGEVARTRRLPVGWRQRLLLLSSERTSLASLLLFSAAVMSVGILTVRSRSGALIMLLTFLFFAAWNLVKQPIKLLARLVSIALVTLILAVLTYNGAGVADRIAQTSWGQMDGRVAVWKDTVQIIKGFWLTGSGWNTYGVAMLHFQTVQDGYRYIEAHNDYLQLAAEGGLLVGIPAIVFVIALIVTIYRRFRAGADDTRTYWLRVGAVAAICAIAVQSVTDFTLQIPGAFVMFATVLAIAIHHPRPRPSKDAV